MKTSAIIVAAGKGSRMQSDIPKQFLVLGNRTVLFHTIQKFLRAKQVFEIIVVVAEEYIASQFLKDSIPNNSEKPIKVVAGGKTRQESVEKGLNATSDAAEYVLTHDGVRPLIEVDTIESAIDKCAEHNGVIVGFPAVDTLTKVDGIEIQEFVDRKEIWQLQTPQIFPKEILRLSFEKANLENKNYTDESSMVKPNFQNVVIFKGQKTNIKITVQEDLIIARAIMEHTNEN